MPSWSHATIKLLLQNSVPLSNRIAQLPPTFASMPVRYAWTMFCADFFFNGITMMNYIFRHIAVSV